jgi:hypothetical protein
MPLFDESADPVAKESGSSEQKHISFRAHSTLRSNLQPVASGTWADDRTVKQTTAFRPHRPAYARPPDSKRIALSVALPKTAFARKRKPLTMIRFV